MTDLTWTLPRSGVRPGEGPHPRRPQVAIVSTYPPRHCGIATFAGDLRDAMNEVAPDLETVVCAVDRDGLTGYGPEVAFKIRQDRHEDYAQTAAAIADSGVSAVVIEHEFGIYGGPDGAWITRFADVLHERGVPYLVTLHTQLSHPSPGQAAVLHKLCRRAFAVSVFTETARQMAVRGGIVAPDRLVVVPHGAPVVLRAEPSVLLRNPRYARQIRQEFATLLIESHGSRMLSTFGLISPGKGLETAIAAVAAVAAEHPDVRYVIAGATHPEVVKQHGEDYRNLLGQRVRDLGIEDNVRFLDFFLTDVEIALLLQRTEVFLTPYRSREQISSGALTFALAAGCPVVSTDYHYARDMLAAGAGLLVDPDDAEAFGEALRGMLAEPDRMAGARRAAAGLGAELSWPAVGHRFAEVLRQATLGADPSWADTYRPRRHGRDLAFAHVGAVM